MHDPRLIWRLGRWIARRENGAARLVWSGGEVVLRIHRGRIHSVDGVDASQVASRLGIEPIGLRDLLEEARALARDRAIAETQAVGTAKEVLQEAIHSWLLDPDRELELVEGEPDEADGPTISVTHAIVELVLSDIERDVASAILPDRTVLLRRTASFLELYAPLRLSEEADLIVAKITGQRTADEIAERSPHGTGEVFRLLAALVATGMLEPIPVATAEPAEDFLSSTFEDDDLAPPRRRIPVAWVVAAAALLLALIAALAFWWTRQPDTTSASSATSADGTHWGLVVDMGCEPEELQRMLKVRSRNPSSVVVIPTDTGEGEECWRLVWGQFESQADAEGASGAVPDGLARDGFVPHAVELPNSESGDPAATGEAS